MMVTRWLHDLGFVSPACVAVPWRPLLTREAKEGYGCNCGGANSAQPQVDATHNHSTLSGSTPVGDSHVGAGVTRIPQRISATRRTPLHRRAMQQHSLHQAVIREGVRTHGGVRGHVPRPLLGSQQICYQRTSNAHNAHEPWALTKMSMARRGSSNGAIWT